KDQSGGLFVPSFEVVAQVVADSSYAYYGANSSSGRTDVNCTKLISEALQKAAAGVDFSKFKHNGGDIPLVSIYHAGPGEHSSYEVGCDDYLWAHFSTRSFTVQGINVKSYFVGNELLQAYKLQDGAPVPTRANIDGMGVFVHEFGHALGLPDFYYTGSNAVLAETLQTPHYWSVMDYGQYAYDGYRPMGMSAYERAMLGWLKYSELTTAGIYSLSTFDSTSDAPSAYKITSNNNGCEFYFLEYRTPSRWYPSHMGEGMLITHIDYSANAWSMNQVNNDPNRQRYQVVAADNERGNMDENDKLSWAMVRGDLWGTSDACREFSDTSTPAAVLNDGGKLSQPLYAIDFTASGDMEFVFMDATLVGIEQTPLEQPAGITSTTQIYDISGKKLSGGGVLDKGLYIIRQNGVSKKVMVK
ncbi:MAG: M6 family metalloprotease domain-containing protein, partial [Bacteroidaceae bacterium]|nr:M6 family metalloprotease domain-containing protein [Bacteroidaceae bacterium]